MSIQTDDDGKTFLSVFPTLSYEDQLVSLRELTAIPQPVGDTIALLLQLVQQSSADDLLRIEALKVIGLYADQSQQPMIMRGIRELLPSLRKMMMYETQLYKLWHGCLVQKQSYV
ncbi:hypothetical protein [Paenibacillus peoriae]|uniref:hypothetical protein n=1 Tax=Paenibacillus peoriae TaxID=59893 RepID=UPI00208DF323|nr:hypothetical protein [Paenibacillus peoriae]